MRWIVRLLSAVLMLALVLLGVLFLVPSDRVAALAAAEFRKATGRDLTLTGAVRPSVWPLLGVRTGAVSIANAAWSDEGPMLQAEALSIGLDMAALLGGDVRISGIEAVNPVLVLEQGDGRANWRLDSPAEGAGAAGAPGAGTPFTLDRAQITGGTVTYVDHDAGTRLTLSQIELATSIPAFDGPVDFAASAVLRGQNVSLTATIATFAPFLAGRVVPVAATLGAGGSTVVFDGRLGLTPAAADGRLQARLADLPAVFAALDMAAPDLPEGLGRRSANVEGALTLTPEGSVHLRDGALTLDGNSLRGAFDLVPGEKRPRVTAQLEAGALDLSALGGAASGGGAAPASGTAGWSDAPIDASGLGAVDAAIALAADSIDLGTARLGRTRVGIAVDAARAVFDLREVQAYGGNLTGEFVINARKGLSVGGDLTLAGLALQPLLADLAGQDRLVATADARLKFLGSGNSQQAIMQGLRGSGSFAFGKGELRGLDLAGMLRRLDPGYVGEGQKTIFDSLTASFAIADGVLTNDDLALKAPLVTATGKGRVGLGAQTLDYRITPVALSAEDGTGGYGIPLLITGPWSDPAFALDLQALADEKLSIEKEKLEAEARAQLAEKAKEELGIEVQDGEDLEAAARRRAEEVLREEAARALKNLLGGN